MPLSPARATAFDILQTVNGGGYASDLLRRATHLDTRDAGLASEIVFGVLRYRAQLDHLIVHFAGRHVKLDPEVRTAIRMGIYQLRYMDRIPPHAAVGDSVALTKRAKKTSAAGLANAVLRKVNRDPVEWPTREIELSCPQWLLTRWEKHYGLEAATNIARAALKSPDRHVNPETGRVQDIGSQSVIPLLDLQPGQRFLDLCAAPGNKTAQALVAAPDLKAVACDLYSKRLAGLKSLGIPLVVLDATQPLPFSTKFDRILVDAPCSGTGTLGRNPEIKWRLRVGDLVDLSLRQGDILAIAREALAPGGILVYSTCSLETEENEEIAGGPPALERLPGRDPGDGFWAAVIKS